jgi:predicted O-methyltransferase YrrM
VAAPSNEATIREELRRMFADERPVVADARSRSADSAPPSPEEGALLAWLAGRLPLTSGPSDVVEIGAAGGVAALHMIPALPPTATLTMIEPDTNAHALASEAIEVAGHTDRVRAILGDPAEVLPRLADERYGMCVLQGSPTRYLPLLPELLRVLAPGGVLVARGVLRRGEHGTALARFLATVSESDELHATVLEEHEGVLLVTRH